MTNPFIGVGGCVSGERLVGRDRITRKLERLLKGRGNCSISGLRRIGKTSLGRQVCYNIQNASGNIRCVEIAMNTIESEHEFYEKLSKTLWKDDNSIDTISGGEHELYLRIVDKLEDDHRKEKDVIIMLDELDQIRNIPRSNILVNRIREIANNPACGVTFFFISARSLRCLEDNTGNVSNLNGICTPFYLPPLSRNEGLKQMLRRVNCDDEAILDILYKKSGGHPFLAEMLLYHAIELAEDEQVPLCADHLSRAIIGNDCASSFITYYDALESFISSWDNQNENQTSGKAFDSFLDIVVGPKLGEPDSRLLNFFKSYGLIKEDGLCMSEHLLEYLTYKRRQQPFEPLLNDLERSLRDLIKKVFNKKFESKDWVVELSQKDDFLKDLFCKLNEMMNKEQKQWHLGCSTDILEYSYPDDLKQIICRKWSWFQSYVGDSPKIFEEWMASIAKIRTPVKHNRPPELIPPEEYEKAKRACQKLLERLAQKK